jgi:hypothetical protein
MTATPSAHDATPFVKDAAKGAGQHVEHEAMDPSLRSAFAEAFVTVAKRSDDGDVYIKSVAGDPEDPRSWPKWKRCTPKVPWCDLGTWLM